MKWLKRGLRIEPIRVVSGVIGVELIRGITRIIRVELVRRIGRVVRVTPTRHHHARSSYRYGQSYAGAKESENPASDHRFTYL